MAEKDVDEQFAAIMAHWDDVALGLDPSGDPHPDAPDDKRDDPTRDSDAVEAAAAAAPVADEPVRNEPTADDVVEDPEDVAADWDADREEDHYTPPPPAPLPPSEDKHFWLMVVALV